MPIPVALNGGENRLVRCTSDSIHARRISRFGSGRSVIPMFSAASEKPRDVRALEPDERVVALRALVREVVAGDHVAAVRERDRVEVGAALERDQVLRGAHLVHAAVQRRLESA